MRRPVAIGLTVLAGALGSLFLVPRAVPAAAPSFAILAPWDASLQMAAAGSFWSNGEQALGGQFASRAIKAMPYAQPALTLATVGGAAADETASLNLSAALGWRDPITNARLVEAALTANNPTIAAQRVDALGRAGGGENAARAADAVMRMQGGPQALADRASRNSEALWWITYLRLPPADPESQAGRLAFARSLDRENGPWHRRIVGTISANLTADGADDVARELWRQTLADPRAVNSLLYDGEFRNLRIGGQALGGEWRIVPRSPARVDQTGGAGITLTRQADGAGAVLIQQFPAVEGAFQLRAEGPDAGDGAEWRVQCAGEGLLFQSERAVGQWQLAIPSGCEGITLELHMREDAVSQKRIQVSKVSLEQAG
ncbi:hypothetical protein [Parerythrobacter jejuensis]|uniref:Uncharacterized protein n=1 Tax=Parerythrobacter jejuensis TaxID=795812 RepID=A0A845AXD3_9SPHN|nr:hypothetical protein [Parerythrobacter jejuensis]MXP31105.1 hypothetical protein [Parerythrobacter jejuensis]MXP33865.1 hypothetical protein [Parerythrobacter jejuensis]